MNSPTNLTLMELPYIQDIAGDKTETPVAFFCKTLTTSSPMLSLPKSSTHFTTANEIN